MLILLCLKENSVSESDILFLKIIHKSEIEIAKKNILCIRSEFKFDNILAGIQINEIEFGIYFDFGQKYEFESEKFDWVLLKLNLNLIWFGAS